MLLGWGRSRLGLRVLKGQSEAKRAGQIDFERPGRPGSKLETSAGAVILSAHLDRPSEAKRARAVNFERPREAERAPELNSSAQRCRPGPEGAISSVLAMPRWAERADFERSGEPKRPRAAQKSQTSAGAVSSNQAESSATAMPDGARRVDFERTSVAEQGPSGRFQALWRGRAATSAQE